MNYDIKAYPTIAFLYKNFIIDYQGQQIVENILKGARKAVEDYKEFDKNLPNFNDVWGFVLSYPQLGSRGWIQWINDRLFSLFSRTSKGSIDYLREVFW